MYFVKRGKTYHDLTGVPFRRFWKEGANGLRATVGDFPALHLSTLFPEVRLKQYLRAAHGRQPAPGVDARAVRDREGACSTSRTVCSARGTW